MESYKDGLLKRLAADPELAQLYLNAAKADGGEVYELAKRDVEESERLRNRE